MKAFARLFIVAVAAVVGAIAFHGSARAALTGGPAGGLIAAPASVDDQPAMGGCAVGWTNPNQQGFNERQGVVLAVPLEVDPGGVFVPAGMAVDSHMILLNTPGGGAAGFTETWCFDGVIVGVISDEDGLLEAASNAVLGWPGTCYPAAFATRGLEPALGDGYVVHGNTIEVTMNVTSPGDWIRVITTRQPTTGITFSMDRQSASDGGPDKFAGTPIEEGAVLTVGTPRFRLPNPAVTPAPRPGILANPAGLGIVATPAGFTELDALSFGLDAGDYILFSVDEWAVGCGGGACAMPSAVRPEGAAGLQEAAADVFASDALLGGGGNWKVLDGNGVLYPGVGLVEPNPPAAGAPDAGDNLDALDTGTRSVDLDGPIYFSLEGGLPDPLEGFAGSGTAAANGVSGSDVLVITSCNAIVPAVYATAAQLRLDPVLDDLDALALLDNGDAIYQPAMDQIFYSVRRGSAIIGVMDCGGRPITEGDVLTVQAGCPVPRIVVSHAALGLIATDELDALDRAVMLTRTSVDEGLGLGTGRMNSYLGAIEPNPFNPETRVSYSVPAGGADVTLVIYDAQGRQVRTLVDGRQAEGTHAMPWDGRDDSGALAGSGVYFLRLEAAGVRETAKMTLLK